VRQISDTRTPEQAANAIFWDAPAGTQTPPGIWSEEAVRLAVKYHLKERETAHVLALINMVAFDAIVASHDAKFFYWLMRPSQADPLITTAIFLPNFPSYPSNHAAISAAMAGILGAMFPAEKSRLDALADEAALSRVLGGIHYRFDGEAGLALGRMIAAWALDHDVVGHQPFVLR
jgi:membrane-associated phospholipid phosphatase